MNAIEGPCHVMRASSTGLVIEPEDIVEENNQTAASTATAVFISKGSELTEQQLNQAPSIVYVEREG